jgi:hypothetical protein
MCRCISKIEISKLENCPESGTLCGLDGIRYSIVHAFCGSLGIAPGCTALHAHTKKKTGPEVQVHHSLPDLEGHALCSNASLSVLPYQQPLAKHLDQIFSAHHR